MIPEIKEQLAITRKELAETQAKLCDLCENLSELRGQLQVERPPQVAPAPNLASLRC
jgi:uncharacterized coiled-coil protein SlyX